MAPAGVPNRPDWDLLRRMRMRMRMRRRKFGGGKIDGFAGNKNERR